MSASRMSRLCAGAAAASLALTLVVGTSASAESDEDLTALELLESVAPDEVVQSVLPDQQGSSEAGDVVATLEDRSVQVESSTASFSLTAPEDTATTEFHPVLMKDASALIAIVITAPGEEEFTFALDTPAGATARLEDDGSVMFVDDEGNYQGGVASPWARDSNGADVPTHFELNGDSLVQRVDLDSVPADAYPVIADPWAGHQLVAAAWVTNQGGTKYVVNATPTSWGEFYRGIDTHKAHVAELKAKLGSLAYKVTPTIDNQFICHVAYGFLSGGKTYNMESWRPNHHWSAQGNPFTQCNP